MLGILKMGKPEVKFYLGRDVSYYPHLSEKILVVKCITE